MRISSRASALDEPIDRELVLLAQPGDPATLHSTYDGMAAVTAARRREAEEAVAAGHQGTFGALPRERWWPDVEIAWGNGRRTRGTGHLAQVMDDEVAEALLKC
ncbi:hypothetical protein [Nonomuraea sp. NPDC003201]